MLDKENVEQYYQSFSSYQNNQLKITLLDNKLLLKSISNKCKAILPNMAYARMLIPTLFPNLDRILYLDYDTVIIKKGIEQLYNIDFKDNYIAAYGNSNIKESITDSNSIVAKEFAIFKDWTNFYFNSGVIVFNIKKIIKDGKDKELLNILSNPPTNDKGEYYFQFHDQSLLNYIFKNNVLEINPIFNSYTINSRENYYFTSEKRKERLQRWKFKSEKDYIDNIVIAHFTGPQKPWKESSYINIYQKELHNRYKDLIKEITK